MVASTLELSGCISDSDHEIDEYTELLRIARQDQAAFESLYTRYYPRLYRFALRILSNPMLAEEAASDTLYAVWTGAGGFQRKSKVSTWIFGIGYRTALKANRTGLRHARITDFAENPDELVDLRAGNDPAMHAEVADETSAVLAALNKLSPAQKAVADLTALGFSCAEISEIVGCPANTVKTRMFNARKKLRQILDATHVSVSTE